MTADQVVDVKSKSIRAQIIAYVVHIKGLYDEVKPKFLAAAEKSPLAAMEQYGHDLARLQVNYANATEVFRLMESVQSDLRLVDGLRDLLRKHSDSLLAGNLWDGASTNPMTNVLCQAMATATCETIKVLQGLLTCEIEVSEEEFGELEFPEDTEISY